MKFPWRDLVMILLLAAIGRVLLLASGTVSFHSDEAVVSLMARHIFQGARPTFFYGQAYMGSLDAWLVALGFQLLGESVQTVRIVQSGLYLLVVATGFLAAWQLSARRIVAIAAGLLLAVPPVNMALYTTATLGGYNETLLFGHIMIILTATIIQRHNGAFWHWALLGLFAGLAWWTNGLIVVYILPIGVAILALWWRQRVSLGTVLPRIAVGLIAFLIGSAPWWIFDLTHDHAALATFLTNRQSGEFAGIGLPYVPPAERALGLLLIGLPALIGMRFPWSSLYFVAPVGVLAFLIYLLAAAYLVRHPERLQPGARGLVLLLPLLFIVVFVASSFGADSTGRYFLPLLLPLGVMLGMLVDSAWHTDTRPALKALSVAAVALIVGYQAAGQVAAARSATGFTTQFDLVSHVPNTYDAELVTFLQSNNLHHGHTNYWVAYRLAFLSGESLQYSASLPYKADLSYNAADNRYTPYRDAAAAAERVAYITTNLPPLNTGLEALWAGQDITYQYTQIGLYHVYYDFEPGPPALDLASLTASTG